MLCYWNMEIDLIEITLGIVDGLHQIKWIDMINLNKSIEDWMEIIPTHHNWQQMIMTETDFF